MLDFMRLLAAAVPEAAEHTNQKMCQHMFGHIVCLGKQQCDIVGLRAVPLLLKKRGELSLW